MKKLAVQSADRISRFADYACMQDMYNSTFPVGCRNERCSLFPPKQTTINVPLRMHKKQKHTEYYWSSSPAISKLNSTCFFLVFYEFFCVFRAFLVQMAQMLALGFNWWVEKPYYRRKTSLALGGTQTPDFANSKRLLLLNYCST